MNKSSIAIVTVTAAVALIQATPAYAQSARVRSGDRVWITDTMDRLTDGVVTGVTPTTLTVRSDGTVRTWDVSEMREVWKEGDSLRNGALIGAASGGGAGVLLGIGWGLSSYENPGEFLAAGIAVGVLGGMGAGMAIDSLFKGRTRIYTQRQSTPLAAAPLLGPNRTGLRVTWIF